MLKGLLSTCWIDPSLFPPLTLLLVSPFTFHDKDFCFHAHLAFSLLMTR